MDVMGSVVKMVSSLAVVLALVLLAAAAARRWLGMGSAGRGPMPSIRMAGSLALGGRRSVLVLEIAGRTLVVGATPQQLVLLTQFDKPDIDVLDEPLVLDAESVRTEPLPLVGTWQARFGDTLRECAERLKAGTGR
jgi:flagellar biosynthetic protein FliO